MDRRSEFFERDKWWREKTTESMLRRGVIAKEQAATMYGKNRWERAVEDGLSRPKNPKRWCTIKELPGHRSEAGG